MKDKGDYQMVKCFICEGDGYVWVENDYYFDKAFGNYLPRRELKMTCDNCGGTGEVKEEIDDEIISGEETEEQMDERSSRKGGLDTRRCYPPDLTWLQK